MIDSPRPSNLNGLVELSRCDGVDIKPTLLRVLTDLYVHKPAHTNDEERQFVELTLRLLDVADVPARAAVARVLASYAAAPLPLLRRLARDDIEVAEPVLRHSPCLDNHELRSVVEEMGLSHAKLVAARFVQPEAENGAAEEIAAAAEPAVADPSQPQAYRAPPAAASELSELFFAANAAERREILLNIEFAPIAPPRPPLEASETVRRLERAALQHHVEEVIRGLERSLGLAPDQARRIISDESGEALVVVAKTLNMPSAVLQRILLFVSPIVSQSVERIYELMRLYDEIKPEAALRLLTIWQDTNGQRPAAKHSLRASEEAARARDTGRPAAAPAEQRAPSDAPVSSRQ
jgi:uncharacterized protein (DUF2336 family)